MHETALMANILSIATENLKGYNIEKVNSVSLKVGRLANVLNDALEFAFESQTASGLFKGARLDIEIVPITACCEKCGKEFQSMDIPPLCPVCGSNEVKITGGTEIFIDSVDVDEDTC